MTYFINQLVTNVIFGVLTTPFQPSDQSWMVSWTIRLLALFGVRKEDCTLSSTTWPELERSVTGVGFWLIYFQIFYIYAYLLFFRNYQTYLDPCFQVMLFPSVCYPFFLLALWFKINSFTLIYNLSYASQGPILQADLSNNRLPWAFFVNFLYN